MAFEPHDPDYVPSGINMRSNDYYKKINHVKLARDDSNRTEFLTEQFFYVTLTGLTGSRAVVGDTITATVIWIADPVTITGYQWKLDGTNIEGATSSTYVPVVGDDLGRLTCEVTTVEYGSRESRPATVVQPLPVNTVAPAITPATPDAGDLLTVSDGTWDNASVNTTTSYQWYRNDVLLQGATANNYQTTTDDDQAAYYCIVRKANSGGSATAASNTVTTAAQVPTNVTAPLYPVADGQIGTPITVTRGAWTHSPTSYSYAHYLGGVEQAQVGTAQTFIPDAEGTWTSRETATNSAGNSAAQQTSNSVNVISVPVAPFNTVQPVYPTENLALGNPITVTAGTWGGNPTPSIDSYNHYRNGQIQPAVGNAATFTPDAEGTWTSREYVSNTSGPANALTSNSVLVEESSLASNIWTDESDTTGKLYRKGTTPVAAFTNNGDGTVTLNSITDNPLISFSVTDNGGDVTLLDEGAPITTTFTDNGNGTVIRGAT